MLLLPACLFAQLEEELQPAGLAVFPYRSKLVATGDLDGDGRSDYLLKNTAHTTDGTLSWLPNTADGVIRMPRGIPTAGGVNSLIIEDMDGDGDQDVFYHLYSGSLELDPALYWAENLDGQGLEWKTHAATGEIMASPNSDAARFGDLDGDGRSDVVFSTRGEVRFLLHTDDGFGPSRLIYEYRPTYDRMTGYLGDVTGDGAEDLIYSVEGADYAPDTLRYCTFTGRTDGGFNDPVDLLTYRGRLLPPFDYDSDGRVDIAINFLDSVRIHPSGGAPTVVIPHDFYTALAVDVTGDGQNDLLFADYSGFVLLPVVDGRPQATRVVGRGPDFQYPILSGSTESGTRELLGTYYIPGYGTLPGRVDLDGYLAGTALPSPVWYPADLGQLAVEPSRPGAFASYVAPGFETYPAAVYRISPEEPDDRTWYTVRPVFIGELEYAYLPFGTDIRHIVRADFNRDGYPDFLFELEVGQYRKPTLVAAHSLGRPGAYESVAVPEYEMGDDHSNFDRTLEPADRFPFTVINNRYEENCTVRVLHNEDADGRPDREQCLELFPDGTSWESTGAIVAPDLDHDGHADLVIIRGNLPPAYLRFDPVAGEFAEAVDLPIPAATGGRSFQLTVGDVDGNGFEDLSIISRGQECILFTGYRDGIFREYRRPTPAYLTATDAAWTALDADQDGRDELLYLGSAGRWETGLDDNNDWWQTFTAGAPVAADGGRAGKLGRHVLTDMDGDGDTDILFHDDRLLALTNLARDARYTIATYYDTNGNNRRDGGEPLLPGMSYAFRDFPVTARRDYADGRTTLYTSGSGETELRVDAGPLWKIRPGYLDVNLGLPAKARRNVFAAIPTSAVHAAELTLTAGRMRCNTEVPVWITLKNEGNQIIPSSYIAFYSDPDLKLITPPDSLADGRSYFRTDSLLPGGSIVLPLQVEAPGVDALPLTVVLSAAFDQRIGNAVRTLEATEPAVVRCSYDPNDKQVSPAGHKAAGYLKGSPELTYTIRFQNTGNDTAYLVVLRDTIDTGLDLSTLTLLGYSHPVSVDRDESSRALVFRFADIMLVDSLTNPPGSQGYVTYSLRPRETFAEDNVITNRAGIYFDYNPPIITNTVINTILRPDTSTVAAEYTELPILKLGLAPNPAREATTLLLEGEEWERHLAAGLTARLTGANGRSLRRFPLADPRTALSVRGLPPGIYLLSIHAPTGVIATLRVAIQR